MNFFKDKRKIIVAFSREELEGPGVTVRENMQQLLPLETDIELRIDIRDSLMPSLVVMSLLLGLGREARLAGAHLNLILDQECLRQLKALHFESYFDSIEGVTPHGR